MEKGREIIRRFLLVALLVICLIILSITLLPNEYANAQGPGNNNGSQPITPTLQLTGAGWIEVTSPLSVSNISTLALTPVDCNVMSPPVVGFEISRGQDSNNITDFANDLMTNGFSVGTVDISAGPIPPCVDVLIVQAWIDDILLLPPPYTPAEGSSLKTWAAGGHSLMVSGEWGTLGSVTEALFQAYGYSQQGGFPGVVDPTDSDPVGPLNTWVIYQTDNFGSHPILNGVASLELLTSSWLSPATNAIVTTDADATPSGQPVMAAFIDGLGCVALSADSNWYSVLGTAVGYPKQQNAKVARQMIQWLSSCTQLTLTKTATPNPVTAGQILTYTLTVTNNSVSSVTNVLITDTIPANTAFVAATQPHNGPDATGVITWPLGTLNFNASVAVTMTVQVNNSTPNGTIINNTAWITSNEGLTGTASATVNVVASQLVTVTGLVWQDTNGDAIYDVGTEPVLPNITVVVTDSLGAPLILVTDVSGRYTATVPIGTVTIDVDQVDPDLPANSILTTANDPAIVTISAGGTSGADFGFQPHSTVTGVVWQDLNGDGIIDALEPVLPNITVVITDSLGIAQILVTDANGYYTATIPSGMVTIDIDQSDLDLSPNSTLTTANDPTTVIIPAGGTGGTNFGFQSPTMVTGLVWQDQNGNGNIDMLEPVLPNITVIITKNNGVSETLVTDSTGRYSTAVPSGTVTIDVDQTDPDLPANSFLTTANDPSIVTIPDGGFAGTHFGFRQSPTPPSVPPPSAPPSDDDDDDDDDTVIVPTATPISSIASIPVPEPTALPPVAYLPDTGSRAEAQRATTTNSFPPVFVTLAVIGSIVILFGVVFMRIKRTGRVS